MKKPNQIISMLVIGVIAVISGCSTPTSTILPAEAMPAQNPSALTPYRIQPGDALDIKFFYNPELNESVTVRPDGYISLQLVNEVSVAGLELRQVNEMLTERYSRKLKPVVTVIVKSFAGQRVYVGGEVGQQGLLAMPSGLTALQAVMQSGGFKNTTQPSDRCKDSQTLRADLLT